MSLPLVYATRSALEDARRLLPGRCLENLVSSEIRAGNVHAGATRGYVFDSEKRYVATVERIPGRLRPRPRAWLVTDLRQHKEGAMGRITRDPDGLFRARRTGIPELDNRIAANEARESGRSSSSPESAPSSPAETPAPAQETPANSGDSASDTLTGRV